MDLNLREQAALARHAVSVGMTPLIPVPFLDDAVRGALQTHMVRDISRRYRVHLSDDDVRTLADDPRRGFIRGVAALAHGGLLRMSLRKVFFVVEWKRTIELVARTWCVAYLLSIALRDGLWQDASPAELRLAIQQTCTEVGTSPVSHAVRAVFRVRPQTAEAAVTPLSQSIRSVPDAYLARLRTTLALHLA